MGSRCCKQWKDSTKNPVEDKSGSALDLRALDPHSRWDSLLGAIMKDDAIACEKLIATGMDVNEPFKFKITGGSQDGGIHQSRTMNSAPLHLACVYRRPSIIASLLKYGADAELLDNFGRPPLGLVVQYWPRIYFPAFTREEFTEDQQYRSYIMNQHERSVECLMLLLDKNVDPSAVINARMQSALHLCGKYNLRKAADILIEYGANVNQRDIDRVTPLILSATYGNADMIDCLLKHNADTNIQDRNGKTALHCASENDVLPVSSVKRLAEQSADLNVLDTCANTPLHLAAAEGQSSKIKYLLLMGADADRRNNDGCSPLYLVFDCVGEDVSLDALDFLLAATTRVSFRNAEFQLPRVLGYRKDAFIEFRQELERIASTPGSLQQFCLKTIRKEHFKNKRKREALLNSNDIPLILRRHLLFEFQHPVVNVLRQHNVQSLFQSDESGLSQSTFSIR